MKACKCWSWADRGRFLARANPPDRRCHLRSSEKLHLLLQARLDQIFQLLTFHEEEKNESEERCRHAFGTKQDNDHR